MSNRVAVIRTHDRIAFKRCRRMWNWSSNLRGNLTPDRTATPLWLGSGIHFALEDYHGAKHFETASCALTAYAEASRKVKHLSPPDDWREALELGQAMMDYYEDWLIIRDPLTTLVVDGVPQVEVEFEIPIPIEHPDFDRVVYRGAFDRVSVDGDNILWLVEYKSAIRFESLHLPTDPQVTAYCWALNHCYPGYAGWGVIYQQHKKVEPKEPHYLGSGKLSSNKSQGTSYRLYRDAIVNMYGSVEKAPKSNRDCLNHLASTESEDRDPFIRRDRVSRTKHELMMEEQKILAEANDILNPEIPLYPNPTRDCSFCSFHAPCMAFDDGSDWEQLLEENYISRKKESQAWRRHLKLPE